MARRDTAKRSVGISALGRARDKTIAFIEKSGKFRERHLKRLAKLDRMIMALQLKERIGSTFVLASRIEREAELIRRLNEADVTITTAKFKGRRKPNV